MSKAKRYVAVNSFLHNWGYVEGHWVYVPLWDPAPDFRAFRQLVAANALADAAKILENKEAGQKLRSLSSDLLGNASKGFLQAWEDGDPICPPFPWPFPPRPHWPPIPFPWPPFPGPGPDPGPIDEFIKTLRPGVQNAVMGNMVSIIGEMINDQNIVDFGNEISGIR